MKKRIFGIMMLMSSGFMMACSSNNTDTTNTVVESEKGLDEENEEVSEEAMQESYYALAKEEYDNKKYISAINTIDLDCNGSDPDGIKEKAQSEIDSIRSYASAVYLRSVEDVVFINKSGTLTTAGSSDYVHTLGWNDLKQIEELGYRLVALKNDGTVEISDFYLQSTFKQDNPDYINQTKGWSDVVSIATVTGYGENNYIFGLKSDGTVLVACEDESKNEYKEVESWTNIVKIVGNNTTYGLYGMAEDGNILCTSEYTFGQPEDVIDFDSESFCVLVSKDTVEVKGIGIVPTGLECQNILDVEVGWHYAAFLYDNGMVKVWNIDTNEVNFIDDLDNVAAISGTRDFIVAYKCNGDIAIIGDTDDIRAVSTPGIDIIDMQVSRDPSLGTVVPESIDSTEKNEYEPAIGMTKEGVLASSWGEPKKKNITETYWGTHEQWVYSMSRYVYFENGLVTAIQKSE